MPADPIAIWLLAHGVDPQALVVAVLGLFLVVIAGGIGRAMAKDVVPEAELHRNGWTASRSPCGENDVDAR